MPQIKGTEDKNWNKNDLEKRSKQGFFSHIYKVNGQVNLRVIYHKREFTP